MFGKICKPTMNLLSNCGLIEKTMNTLHIVSAVKKTNLKPQNQSNFTVQVAH